MSDSTEHPPAAGTALGLVIHGWSWSAVVFILSSALILSVLRSAPTQNDQPDLTVESSRLSGKLLNPFREVDLVS